MVLRSWLWVSILSLFTLPSALAQDHKECLPRELKLKSCILKTKSSLKELKVTLGPTKITWLDGSWRAIVDFPDSKNTITWQEAKLREIHSRYFLELKIWKKIEGEVKVESLQWIVAEIKDKNFHVHLSQIVGKRKPADDPSKPAEEISDTMLSTSLEKKGEKEIEWVIGKEKGVLSHGI